MNRTLLWCTLLFIAFVAVFPALQLLTGAMTFEKYFKLGPDLQGGARLVYSLDNPDSSTSTEQVVTVLTKRVDPTATKNYIIRPASGGKLEIIMAGADAKEVETVKSLVRRNGYLKFQILADPDNVPNFEEICKNRLKNAAPPPEYRWVPLQWNSRADWPRAADFLFGPKSGATRQQAMEHNTDWQRVAYEKGQSVIYVIHPSGDAAAPAAGEPAADAAQPAEAATAAASVSSKKAEVSDIEVLILNNTPVVEGADFARTYKGSSYEDGSPIIHFEMKSRADVQNRLATLTGQHKLERMGIILDGKLQSAPTIQAELRDGGIITGYRQPGERDQVLAVIQSGTLDVNLTLHTEGFIGPELGKDNINRGLTASVVSFLVVMVFMAGYYLFGGVVADLAVIANLLIIVLIMHWMQGTWTLPGIAGLILTVGMAVDANVLVFERMREELARGSSMRLAVRNGYSRALPAIVDGNLTTFFTAVILAWVGSPDVKGFAIVLIIGLATSMFTALLFTRAIFDLMIGAGLLRNLRMFQFFKSSNIPFTRLMPVAFTVSAIMVAAGLILAFAAGEDKYAMEFRGGTQVEINFKQGLPIDTVRARVASLDEGLLIGVKLAEATDLDSVRAKVAAAGDKLKNAIVTTANELNAEGLTQDFNVQVFGLDAAAARQAVVAALQYAGEPSVLTVADQGLGYANAVVQPVMYSGLPDDQKRYIVQVLSADDTQVKESLEALFKDVLQDRGQVKITLASHVLTPADVLQMQGAAAAAPAAGPTAPDAPKVVEEIQAQPILPDFVKFVGAYQADIQLTDTSAAPVEVSSRISKYLDEREPDKAGMPWTVEGLTPDQAKPGKFSAFKVFVHDERIKRQGESNDEIRRYQKQWDAALRMAIEDPRPLSSSKVDPRIGKQAKDQAMIAIILSLIVIIVYVWFRFARFNYGLAAVISLVHDVSVALGLVIVFSWIGKSVPFIGEMKIDLPMIGAFLTLVGYSLNDTIVIFDRIRENRGKFGELSEAVINNSINQTLSRTVLTSLTVFFVVTILYFFGGVQSTIHGFSFVMTVGVIAGSYSTIFIAAPLLLWLKRSKARTSGGSTTAR